MADIELVIKIPEEKYKWIKENNPKADKNSVVGVIVHGTPLSKGHGRLIDAYDMKDIEFINKGDYNSTRTIREWIDSAPTIIESDKGQEE